MEKLPIYRYFLLIFIYFVYAKRSVVAMSLGSNLPQNCVETDRTGLQLINPPYAKWRPFQVYCNQIVQNGNWTVIQRRIDGAVNFYRPWSEYKEGFGDLNHEFFIGLDKLHYLTSYENQELLIVMTDFNDNLKYAKYSEFEIGNEAEEYILKSLGSYTGTAGDALKRHLKSKFSTFDKGNGNCSMENCAKHRKGGWWYTGNEYCNLNGVYLNGYYENKKNRFYGITWFYFHDTDWYSLKSVDMMIRPTP